MRVLQWFSHTQFASFGSTKSATVYVFLVPLTDHRQLIVQYIFLYMWYIVATTDRGVSAHFSNMYCTILKEMRGREIFNLPGVDVTTVTGTV